MKEPDYNKVYKDLQEVRRILLKYFSISKQGEAYHRQYDKLTEVIKVISNCQIQGE